MGVISIIQESWRTFSREEKRNIAIYVCGIMLYKFGLEAFNGSIVALATNRYDYDAELTKTTPRTFERIGLLTGLNQAFQCVGSILIAPLVVRFPTRKVLSCAILFFGLMSAILLIVDASTGGKFVPKGWSKTHKKGDFGYYGSYNTDAIIPIYSVFAGTAYGMVELIRRVIPRDIVGGNVQKLRRMDALVHIMYEVAGTSGSFCTALALIPRFGNNMSFIITPIFFSLASATWFFISDLNFVPQEQNVLSDKPSYVKAILGGIILFLDSIYTGMKIIFTNRKFIWLLPGYAFALLLHRELENFVAPIIAKRYLGNSAWSQIMVGGSNFGELLGAVFVFMFTQVIKTPIPWLRMDALLLIAVWYIPFWYPPSGRVKDAWVVAGTFIPISFGWAAGDVSLAAYIQASLARMESKTKNVSALGAVMAFLYSTYIVIYAILSPLLGRYVDKQFAKTGGADGGGDVHDALKWVVGGQFTIASALVIAATFIPKGALALNPDMLYDEDLEEEVNEDDDSLKKEKVSAAEKESDDTRQAPAGPN